MMTLSIRFSARRYIRSISCMKMLQAIRPKLDCTFPSVENEMICAAHQHRIILQRFSHFSRPAKEKKADEFEEESPERQDGEARLESNFDAHSNTKSEAHCVVDTPRTASPTVTSASETKPLLVRSLLNEVAPDMFTNEAISPPNNRVIADTLTSVSKPAGAPMDAQSTDVEGADKVLVSNKAPVPSDVAIPSERMGLFKRFHHAYKQYGKVLVTVHCITSACWGAVFYYAAMRGVDVVPALRWIGASDTIISFYTMPGIGNAAVAYLFYKLATPARYPVTIAGTHLAVKYLRQWGYMPATSQENSIRSFVSEGKMQAKAKYEHYQDKMEDIRDELKEKQMSIRNELKEKQLSIRNDLKERQLSIRDELKERQLSIQDKLKERQLSKGQHK